MFPIVKLVDKLEVNGRNWPGYVQVRKNVPMRASIVAQEAWESMHKMDPVKLFFRVFKKNDQDQREFEYMGHEVEVQAARLIYGAESGSIRLREAKSLQQGYDGIFSKLSLTEIVNEMKEREGKASKWVRENLHHLRKYK